MGNGDIAVYDAAPDFKVFMNFAYPSKPVGPLDEPIAPVRAVTFPYSSKSR